MINTYNIENETCSKCDHVGELTYSDMVQAIHCGYCGEYSDTENETESETKTFTYHNVDNIVNGDGHMLESVEIEAGSLLEADEIYRGIVGTSAQNEMRDSHLE